MTRIMQEIAAASLGTIKTDDSGSFEAVYLFPEKFCGFAGHFPEHPILPAIVEIMTAVSLVGEHAGSRQRLVAVEEAKFLVPVRPNQQLLVSCRPRTLKGKILFEAKLSVAGTVSASFLIELAGSGELP